MRIRITCLPPELPHTLEQFRALFDVRAVSKPYSNRGESKYVAVHLDVRPRSAVITPVVANHVLAHFGAGGYEAGQFTRDLILLIARADIRNKYRLALGHPDYVAAVVLAQAPGGAEQLAAIASTETAGR